MPAIARVKTSLLVVARSRALDPVTAVYLFCGFDELHGYKIWDILEAMQGDPTRTDVMIWITSYASLYHAGRSAVRFICAGKEA